MPIVRPYPIGEVSPQPIPNVAPSVPAAGDINLFGGNRARDLQVAGQNLGQASVSLFALYQRHAQDANDTRVQDLNNRFLDGSCEIMKTGPDAYYNLSGADAITSADAATARLTGLKDEVFGQATNDYQRQRLAPILDAHLAAATAGIMRHTAGQQAVYARGVAANAIETSQAEAKADPSMMDNAVMRAEGAARVLHAGQPPEAVEAGVRTAGASIVASVIGDRLARPAPVARPRSQRNQGPPHQGERGRLRPVAATPHRSRTAPPKPARPPQPRLSMDRITNVYLCPLG
jgi:hypothetical protein